MAVAIDLKHPGAVLLVSCYEGGHQPHAIAVPASFLHEAGYQPAVLDLAVEDFDEARIVSADFIAISVPMHTALRIGLQAARRIRTLRPDAHICFVGHYALLHAAMLLDDVADAVLGGEFEADLVAMVQNVERGALVARTVPALTPLPALKKLAFQVPRRQGLPPLKEYAHLNVEGAHRLAGYIESTRGCIHMCRHCPLPAVYDGRLFAVPRDTVLADARQQIAAGAEHLTFGDADFLNAPGHGIRIVEALHAEFPKVTFDFTAKIEHLLQHADRLPELAAAGVLFVVSAVETLNNRILTILDKGHTRDDVLRAQRLLDEAGIALRPSLMPFTPWATRQDLQDIVQWVVDTDLIESVDAVQYSIRLLVPPGSLLLDHPEMKPHVGKLDEEALAYPWQHPDPQVDELQRDIADIAADAASTNEAMSETFDKVCKKVWRGTSKQDASAAMRYADRSHPRRRQRPPRLTEPWFC